MNSLKPFFFLLTIVLAAYVHPARATVVVDGPRLLCQGASATLSAPIGYRQYVWSTGARTRTITITTGGRFTVFCTDSLGNMDSADVTVTMVPRPKPTIGNPVQFLCSGDVATLQAPPQYRLYVWNTGETSSSISIAREGRYWVDVIDSNGCSGSSDTITVTTVNRPEARIRGQDAVCGSGEYRYGVDSIPGARYTWTLFGGQTMSPTSNASILVRWPTGGRIDVRMEVDRPDGQTCVSLASMNVRRSSRLKPELRFRSLQICSGDSLVLGTSGGFSSYRWSNGSTTDSIVVRTTGFYWVEVTDPSGCIGSSDTIRVLVYPVPTIRVAGPDALCPGDTIALAASSSTNDVVRWIWQDGHVGPERLVHALGAYTVTGITLNGCSAEYTWVVRPGIVPDLSSYTRNIVVPPSPPGSSVVIPLDTIPAPLRVRAFRVVAVAPPLGVRTTLWHDDQNPGYTVPVVTIRFDSIGTVDLTVRIVVEGECTDSIDIRIGAVFERAPDSIRVRVVGVDRTAEAGTRVELPFHVTVRSTRSLPTSVLFGLSWHRAVFSLESIIGASLVGQQRSADSVHIALALDEPIGESHEISCIGLALMGSPLTSRIHIDTIVALGFQDTAVTESRDGSLNVVGCGLPFRQILLGMSTVWTAHVSYALSALTVTIESNAPLTVSGTLYTTTGRRTGVEVERQTLPPGTHQRVIRTGELFTGLYLLILETNHGQRVLPVVVP